MGMEGIDNLEVLKGIGFENSLKSHSICEPSLQAASATQSSRKQDSCKYQLSQALRSTSRKQGLEVCPPTVLSELAAILQHTLGPIAGVGGTER
ncbi:uncharacterized protein RHO17_007551 isoform 2-T15 [Thomomys bottae]